MTDIVRLNHRFEGKQDELFARLEEILQWLGTARP
jgi:hypothetical protein